MTDNEKLIEEARVAFTEAWDAEDRRIENWDRDARGTHSRSRAGIRAALAVFQKACTPTDDEREALVAEALRPMSDLDVTHDPAVTRAFIRRLGDALDVTLRRTEVPEPSAEPRHEFDEDVDDCSMCVCGVPADEHWRVEPQGEPSDAQVEAGCAAFYEGAQGLTSWTRIVAAEPDLANRYRDGIRAALRAAGGVR